MELDLQCPDLAAVYASVGGGAFIGGIGSYLKAKRPDVDIIGCWAENASALHQCFERGEIFDAPERNIYVGDMAKWYEITDDLPVFNKEPTS